MSNAKNASRDPLQIFCENFQSHRNLEVYLSCHVNGVSWPSRELDNDIELRISRYTLETLNLVASRKGEPDVLRMLSEAVLELYGPSPVEMICSPKKVATALIKTGLYDSSPSELEKEVAESIAKWLNMADAASRKAYPELAAFRGEAGYVQMNGGVQWGPKHKVAAFLREPADRRSAQVLK